LPPYLRHHTRGVLSGRRAAIDSAGAWCPHYSEHSIVRWTSFESPTKSGETALFAHLGSSASAARPSARRTHASLPFNLEPFFRRRCAVLERSQILRIYQWVRFARLRAQTHFIKSRASINPAANWMRFEMNRDWLSRPLCTSALIRSTLRPVGLRLF